MGQAKRNKALRIAATDAVEFPSRDHITLPERVLHHFGHRYPGVWNTVEKVRKNPRMCGLSGWEPWCYLPINVAAGVLIHHTRGRYASPSQAEILLHHDTRMLAALSAWRMTKGVFSFDPTVLREMFDSDLRDGLPEECFLRLPEWAVFIPTPGIEYIPGVPLHGFFAYVDDHAAGGRNFPPELNLELLIDPRGGPPELRELLPRSLQITEDCAHWHACVELSSGSFAGAMSSMASSLAEKAAQLAGDPELQQQQDHFSSIANMSDEQRHAALAPMIECNLRLATLVLYLCADESDVRPEGLGNRRRAVLASEAVSKRAYMAPTVNDWQVGWRIGADLRLALQNHRVQDASAAQPGGASPRPHIRRAHFHAYWTGPRSAPQERRVKWLPPIPVNVNSSDALIPTLRNVVDTRLPPAGGAGQADPAP